MTDYLEIFYRLLFAMLIGCAIGIDRNLRGKPTGLKTLGLVALGSALVTMAAMNFAFGAEDHNRDAVSRAIQGVITGIGFLGAGVIIHEQRTEKVRGLTTAASIWITAALGILTGVGFYFAAFIGTALALGTLSAFRWIEARLPTETYAIFMVRYARDNAISEPALRSLVQSHGFSMHNLSYRLHSDAGQMEYRMVLRTMDAGNARMLAEKLKSDPAVLDFRIAPTSD